MIPTVKLNNGVEMPKSVTPSRIAENYDIFDFTLSDAAHAAISAFDRNGPTPTPSTSPNHRRAEG